MQSVNSFLSSDSSGFASAAETIGMPFPRWPTFHDYHGKIWRSSHFGSPGDNSDTCGIYWPGFNEPILWFNLFLFFFPLPSTQFLPNEYSAYQTPFLCVLPGTQHVPVGLRKSEKAGSVMESRNWVTYHLAGSEDFVTVGHWSPGSLWNKVGGPIVKTLTSDELGRMAKEIYYLVSCIRCLESAGNQNYKNNAVGWLFPVPSGYNCHRQ